MERALKKAIKAKKLYDSIPENIKAMVDDVSDVPDGFNFDHTFCPLCPAPMMNRKSLSRHMKKQHWHELPKETTDPFVNKVRATYPTLEEEKVISKA